MSDRFPKDAPSPSNPGGASLEPRPTGADVPPVPAAAVPEPVVPGVDSLLAAAPLPEAPTSFPDDDLGERPTAHETPHAASWSGDPASSEGADPLVGMTLSETYVVTKVLGQGGMGRVYEASHTRISQKLFAIKVLHPELATHPDVLARFRREAEAAAGISHPNVVGVYDVAKTADGRPYLVCEHLEGVDLGAHLKEVGPLAPAIAASITRQVCLGLEAAHDRQVIHRDLKPQNVFLVGELSQPTAKLLDFGLARLIDTPTQDGNLTKTGFIMGTPSYMAPEMAKGEKVDHRADIYGAGVILYAALTGKPPFDESSPQATIIAVMSKEPTRPRAINPAIPEHLELVVQRAMAKNPEDRYQSARDLSLALEVAEPPVISLSEGSMAGARRPMVSRTRASLENEASEVETARIRLVLFSLLAAAAAMMGIATAVTSAVRLFAPNHELTVIEFVLLMIAVAGTAFTPVVLAIRRVRQTVWDNTAKVMELVGEVRAPLLAGLATYGVTALVVRLLDGVVSQFSAIPMLRGLGGVAWPGWSALFLVAAFSSVFAVFLRTWLLARSSGRFIRFLAGPGVFTLVAAWVGFIVYEGFVLREGWAAAKGAEVAQLQQSAATAEPTPQPEPPSSSKLAETPAPEGSASPDKPGILAPTRAPAGKLAAALKGGVPALKNLAEDYPQDPAVLKPLALGLSKKPTGHLAAVEAAAQLFEVSPEEVKSRELRLMMVKIAQSESGAERALDVLATGMGSVGPDILYDLVLTSPDVRDEAMTRLKDPASRPLFTTALGIAFDLRTAKSCAARLPLLPSASQLGDNRTIAVLSPLSEHKRTGCGRRGKSICKPKCPREAPQFKKTMAAINARMNSKKRRR